MSPRGMSPVVPDIRSSTAVTCTFLAVLLLIILISMCLWHRKNKKNGATAELWKTPPASETSAGKEETVPRSSHRKLPELPNPATAALSRTLVADTGSVRSSYTNSGLYAHVDVAALDTDAAQKSKERSAAGTAQLAEKQPAVCLSSTFTDLRKKDENVYARVSRRETYDSEMAEAEGNETDTDIYAVVGAAIPPSTFSGTASRAQQGSRLGSPNPDGQDQPIGAMNQSQTASVSGTSNAEQFRQISMEPQVYFSGDSQTSQDSKGYSSISVREPIASLKVRALVNSPAETVRPVMKTAEIADCFYETVSEAEDSEDEVYAAIMDVSLPADTDVEQDVYAVIGDSSGQDGGTARLLDNATSLPEGVGRGSSYDSPKPEKRQVNSPLPPPPVLVAHRKTLDVTGTYAVAKRPKSFNSIHLSPTENTEPFGRHNEAVKEDEGSKVPEGTEKKPDQADDVTSALYAQVVKRQRYTMHSCDLLQKARNDVSSNSD